MVYKYGVKSLGGKFWCGPLVYMRHRQLRWIYGACIGYPERQNQKGLKCI